MADPSQKLVTLLAVPLSTLKEDINNNTIAVCTNLEIKIDGLEARMKVMEQLLAGAKKPLAKKDKAVDGEAATPNNTNEANADGDVPVVKAAALPKSKVAYFRGKYERIEEYRNKHNTPDVLAMLSEPINAKNIADKKKDEQKMAARSNLVWNHIKTDAAKMKEIEAEFAADKKNQAAPQEQLVADQHTPDAK
jgi:hypothetical protein